MEYPSFWELPVFWIIAWALAVWRISSIITREEIGKPLRRLAGIITTRYAGGEESMEIPDTFMGYLFSCLWCMSVWVSLLLIPVMLFFPVAVLPLSVSAGAILLDKHVAGEH